MRDLVAAVNPNLERALDFRGRGVLYLLARFVSPSEIIAAGIDGVCAHLATRRYLMERGALAETAIALSLQQHIVVPGEKAYANVARAIAQEVLDLKDKLA